jgi:hypothetical protein
VDGEAFRSAGTPRRVTRFGTTASEDRRTVHPVVDSAPRNRIVYDDRVIPGVNRRRGRTPGRSRPRRACPGSNAGAAHGERLRSAGSKILESNWFDATSPFRHELHLRDASRLSKSRGGKVTGFGTTASGVKRETLIDVSDPAFEPRSAVRLRRQTAHPDPARPGPAQAGVASVLTSSSKVFERISWAKSSMGTTP